MDTRDQKQAERDNSHKPVESAVVARTVTNSLTSAFPLPSGVTRADRRHVASVVSRFMRD